MSLAPWLRTLGEGLLDLVFAPICVACRGPIRADDDVRLICRLCWARARALPAPLCPRCGEPRLGSAAATACTACAVLVPGIRVVRSAFLMVPPVSDMVHGLKYRGWEAAAAPIGRRLATLALPEDVRDEATLVVPVPVSGARLRERGFNQAERIAAAFAAERALRCLPGALRRTRATETQTALHPDERRANVAGAFAAEEAHLPELRGEHLLLVDDVWTTGATAVACAQALLDAGARAVSVLTFARALPSLRDPDARGAHRK